jgi:Mn-dependent DtxR family transcriptional regulator
MRMKDVLFQVEELHEAGLSVQEIAERLKMDVPVVVSMFEWMAKQGVTRDRNDNKQL